MLWSFVYQTKQKSTRKVDDQRKVLYKMPENEAEEKEVGFMKPNNKKH